MKKYITLFLIILTAKAFSQTVVNDSANLLPGYRQDVYYSLANGTVATDSSHNWDLGFANGVMEVTLMANQTNGITVYKTPYSIADFNTIDTTGYNSWTVLYNPYHDWSAGAFNTDIDSTINYDYGWGYYNLNDNYVYGNRTFLIKIEQNNTTTFKKMYVNYKYFDWVFTVANLDNGSNVTDTLHVSNYQAKNLTYFNLTTNQFIDREPNTSTWDLLFTHYQTDLGGGFYYNVTGALTNTGIKTVKATPVDVNTVQVSGYDSTAYSSDISTIGWDWANFNMMTYQYDMVDSLVYFVKTKNADVYELKFTGFDYTVGVVSFEKMLAKSATGVEKVSANNSAVLGTYPNPTNGSVNLVTNLDNDKVNVQVTNSIGQVVKTISLDNMNGLKSTELDLSSLAQGMYFITLTTDKGVYSAGKIVKN